MHPSTAELPRTVRIYIGGPLTLILVPGVHRVVAVPGHTRGSVAVHVSQTSHTVVLTGSALVTSDGITMRMTTGGRPRRMT